MSDEKEIFRDEALDGLSSPEKFDVLLPVAKPMYWVAAVGAIAFIILFLLWAFFGTITITRNVSGVFASVGYTHQAYCEEDGYVVAEYSLAGNFMKKGDVLFSYKDTSGNLKYYRVKNTGLVIDFSVYPGSPIHVGDSLFTYKTFVFEDGINPSIVVSDSDKYNYESNYWDYRKQAYVFLPEEEANSLSVGMEVKAYPARGDASDFGYIYGDIVFINAPTLISSLYSTTYGALIKDIYAQDISDIKYVLVEIRLKIDDEAYNKLSWSTEEGGNYVLKENDKLDIAINMRETRPIDLFLSQ